MTEPPVAIVTGSGEGHRGGHGDGAGSRRWRLVLVDRCEDDPALRYALATQEDLDGVVAACGRRAHDRRGGRCPRPGRPRRAVARPSPVRPARRGRGRGRGDQRGRAPLDDRRRHLGGDGRHRPGGRARGSPAPPFPPCWRRRPPAGPVRGRGLGGASVGLPLLTALAAAKAGGVGLVRSLAAELGPEGHHRQRRRPRLDRHVDAHGQRRGLRPGVVGRVRRPPPPPGSGGRPIRWRRWWTWLCGEASGAVTGALLPVDAGMTAR